MILTVDAAKLKINPEYEKLLPKLSSEEYEALKLSIKTEGQHYQIVANENFEILDGHHRVRICEELGLEPRFEIKTFANKLLESKFVIESNLHRRHLNKFQKAKLVLPLLEIEKELAKQRQGKRTDLQHVGNISHMSHMKKQRKPLTQKEKQARRLKSKAKREANKKAGILPKKAKRAREITAKKTPELSDRTLEKVKTIMEKGSEELNQKVEIGETSIDSAFKKLKQTQAMEPTESKPAILNFHYKPEISGKST